MIAWSPELAERSGPRYRAIADALSEDIERGMLSPGAQLPTQRDLARALGVTVGTITRAYAEAERRGLVQGEVGRGTFVRGEGSDEARAFFQHRGEGDVVDLSMSIPSPTKREAERALLEKGFRDLTRSHDVGWMSGSPAPAGTARHRQIGARLVRRLGLEVAPGQIVATCGGQHAMTAVLATLARPGDTVLVESVTFPGMKALANLLSLRLEAVEIDDEGIVPEAFERACRDGASRVLYLIPTLQNPTSSILPETRRDAIAGIARRYGVAVVEDEVYGLLPEARPASISARIPELGYVITGASKIIAPGLRVGFAAVPPGMADRVAAAIFATSSIAPQPMVELVCDWVEGGEIDRFIGWRREEAGARHDLVRRVFRGRRYHAHPAGYHVWLELPAPWRPAEFVVQARRRGIAINAAEVFVAGRSAAPHAVRISLMWVADLDLLERSLRTLTGILDDPGEPGHCVV